MKPTTVTVATIEQIDPQKIILSGNWTAVGISSAGCTVQKSLVSLQNASNKPIVADGSKIQTLDTAGAWILQKSLSRLQTQGSEVTLLGFKKTSMQLLEVVKQHFSEPPKTPAKVNSSKGWLYGVGCNAVSAWQHTVELLGFVGETAMAMLNCVRWPRKLRLRPVLFNIRTAGWDALPIVGLLSFLLGVVVAYQGADQLRQYGANIFVADLVGLSMLREFAPLMTAIIIAGRSGSAYAAQIGTMSVTEEIDALYTLGIDPLELLVLPKIIALAIALPLLTVFADVLGVLGGMLMANAQLGVGFAEFLERFTKAVSTSTFLIGIGKAPVFAVIIAVVGCFQGLRTKGGADSVGRQTTRSVVQGIFLVIVADALFSIAFSVLDL